MNPFQSLHDYEEFIYTLSQRFTSIKASTLVLVRRGSMQARTSGNITFTDGYHLVIRERLTTEYGQVQIERYGYEAWHNQELLYWYDSQPHPNDPNLAPNHPHHKHVPPNIKRNRIIALDLSFEKTNLPFLITEVEESYLNQETNNGE